jgi:hypothetical protein
LRGNEEGLTHIDPSRVLLVPDLKTIDLVLQKHSNSTKIGVGSNASGELFIGVLGLTRVMKKSHGGNGAIHKLREVLLLQVER